MFRKHNNSLSGKGESLQKATEMEGKQEIGFNIWFIVDQDTDVCYYYIIKAYCIGGSEEEKLATLNELAKYDFITSPRIKIPENCVISVGNERYKGCLPSYAVDDFFTNNFDYFATEVEKTLPPLFKFNPYTGDNRAITQKLSDAPLHVRTYVLEDDYGNLTPQVSDIKKYVYQ